MPSRFSTEMKEEQLKEMIGRSGMLDIPVLRKSTLVNAMAALHLKQK
jgi:hypothetical protein